METILFIYISLLLAYYTIQLEKVLRKYFVQWWIEFKEKRIKRKNAKRTPKEIQAAVLRQKVIKLK